MDAKPFAVALALAVGACTTSDGQGVDDWGDIGNNRPAGSATAQAIPTGDAVTTDAAVAARLDAGADAAVDAGALVADISLPVDAAPPAPDLPPPPDLAPVVDLRDAEIDTAPPERCPRAAFAAAKGRSDVLLNADFATDAALAGWTGDFGATMAWDKNDADGATASGALAVTNGNVAPGKLGTSLAGVRRCLPVTGGASYQLWAWQLIAAGQSGGTAGLAVQYFAAADCTGAPLGADIVDLGSAASGWTLRCGDSAAPAAAHAMSLRLVVAKTLEDPALTALFDDVVVAPGSTQR